MLPYSVWLFAIFLYFSVAKQVFINGEYIINSYELLEDEKSVDHIDIDAKCIALLIEDSPGNFRKVLNFVQSVLSENNTKDHDLWLITFNSSGVSSVWEKSYNNVDTFYGTLQTLELQSNSESDLSFNKSLSLFALLHTAQIIPPNAAIVIFTNSLMNMDTHLENAVLNSVLSKNITVYTTSDSDQKTKDLIQNIREYSGGKIIKLKVVPKHEDYKSSSYTAPNNISVILSRKNLLNVNTLSFPVDYDIMGIHVIISPSTATSGILKSPSGYRFTFSNKTKSDSIRYSPGSLFENRNGSFDIHLNFSTSGRPVIGTWQIRLENMKEVYNVRVYAFTNIAAQAWIHSITEGINKYDISKDVMKLGVTGNISHITDISVLDVNGDIVLGNVSYKFNNKQKYVTENNDNLPDKELNIEINNLNRTQPFYAQIRGKDVKGSIFQRLSYIFGKSDIYPQQTIVVEVGLGSELILTSIKKAEVYFEVTNQGTNAQLVSFTCSDTKYILQRLSLFKRYLEPQESTIVTLYLNPKSWPATYKDEITFSVHAGSQRIQKKVLIDVGFQIADQNKPVLTHEYTSSCRGILSSQCSKGTWTIEITARDVESGLLQLNTAPRGIFFPYGYTSGTKDSVTGYYSDSCCNPDLQITAVDRMNNRNSYSVNAYHTKLGAGAIAAIVVGILLFIILIVIIVIFTVKRCKQKESYDLPTYRGGGI